jgi:predicted kinase
MIYLPVGIPGCGKSTLLATLPVWVVSTDTIREDLTGDENDQSRNDEVFSLLHMHVRGNAQKTHMAVDATNLEARSRREIREAAGGVPIHVLLFDNAEQAIVRNLSRARRVPDYIMIKMIDKLERAKMEIPREGWASVTTISSVS